MFMFLKIFVLVYVQIIIVQCIVPGLSVRKVDMNAVLRKRQETTKICRIFTKNTANRKTQNFQKNSTQRIKRSLDDNALNDGNPFIKLEDFEKVEKLLVKTYKNVEENSNVTLKPQIIDELTNATTNVARIQNRTEQSGRKYDIAPKKVMEATKPGLGNEMNAIPQVPWHKTWVHGIIPYFINPACYDRSLTRKIIEAFDYFEKVTCIRLQRLRVKPTDMKSLQNVEWVYITNPTRIRQCVHSNERRSNKGVQVVVLGYDCISKGQILHEIMHILGFSHEHTRPDRDKYISINWKNIKTGYNKNFEINNDNHLMHLPYDFESILHYPPEAFSKNGNITINTTVVQHGATNIGQRENLSDIDIEKVSFIYGNECMNRNKDYLIKACPTVINSQYIKPENVSQADINKYFEKRIWEYGVVNYKFLDTTEFSTEERNNIRTVMDHIERLTCIGFRDMTFYMTEIEGTEKKQNYDEEEYEEIQYYKPDLADSPPGENRTGETVENDLMSSQYEISIIPNELISHDDTQDIVPPIFSLMAPSLPKINISIPANGFTLPTTKSPANNKKDNENPVVTLQASSNSTNDSKDSFINLTSTNQSTSEKTRVKRKAPEKPMIQLQKKLKNSLIITRSVLPGCPCPKSGKSSGEKQLLEINVDCFNSLNDLLHLFVHILGLDHQHNAYNRDLYLHIMWDKLSPEVKEDMRKKLPPQATLGLPYDYQSVMHLPWLEIKNGITNVMYPIWNDGWSMGHWQGLSDIDVQKINNIYQEQCAKQKEFLQTI